MEICEPMLAHPLKNKKHALVWPGFVQPKLDGMRCLWFESGLYSRMGNRILSVPGVEQHCKAFFPDMPLDGELYSDELCFEDIMSICRCTVNIADDPRIRFRVYDAMIPGLSFKERWAKFVQRMNCMDVEVQQSIRIDIVPTVQLANEQQMENWMQAFLNGGNEGLMYRNPYGMYQFGKRSNFLLKLKPDLDCEVEVVGFEQGAGRNYYRLGALQCFHAKDDQLPEFKVKVGIGFSDDEREHIWANQEQYRGKTLTLGYQNLTKKGVPRFPKFLRWHPDNAPITYTANSSTAAVLPDPDSDGKLLEGSK